MSLESSANSQNCEVSVGVMRIDHLDPASVEDAAMFVDEILVSLIEMSSAILSPCS